MNFKVKSVPVSSVLVFFHSLYQRINFRLNGYIKITCTTMHIYIDLFRSCESKISHKVELFNLKIMKNCILPLKEFNYNCHFPMDG